MEHVDALAVVWGNATPADRSALEADHEELARLAQRMSVNEFWTELRRRREDDLRDKGESRELRERRMNKASGSWNLFSGRYEARLDAELVVVIDADTLRLGEHTGTVCETVDGVPIPVSLARRLACEAGIIPVVLGVTGEILDLGRTTRLANRAQRRGCASMYRTCAAPGCEVGFDRCEIHHLHWWENGGSTDLGNLVPLCGHHHHVIHDAGFTATLTANRTLRWFRPDGTLDAEQPLRPRTPHDAAMTRVEPHGPTGPGGSGRCGGPKGPGGPGRPDDRPGDSRPATAPPLGGAGEQLILTA